jgi:hypothetical protein
MWALSLQDIVERFQCPAVPTAGLLRRRKPRIGLQESNHEKKVMRELIVCSVLVVRGQGSVQSQPGRLRCGANKASLQAIASEGGIAADGRRGRHIGAGRCVRNTSGLRGRRAAARPGSQPRSHPRRGRNRRRQLGNFLRLRPRSRQIAPGQPCAGRALRWLRRALRLRRDRALRWPLRMRGGTMRSMRSGLRAMRRGLLGRRHLGLRRLQLQLLCFLGTMLVGLLGSTRA